MRWVEVKSERSEYERWERIDGVIYDMTLPPSSNYQAIASRLQGECYTILKGKVGQSFVAPFGVWLDGEEEGNYAEPDLTIVCDPAKGILFCSLLRMR
jgi:Uma2 family endonuclease